MKVGIDASNVRAGGGLTHLANLLAAAVPGAQGITEVTVWAGSGTLARLPDRPWLRKKTHPLLEGMLPYRLLWQSTVLDREARKSCDLLFIPGGIYTGRFRPYVAMSQNLLPFDRYERKRYGLSSAGLRIDILSVAQSATFRRANGIIFLTESARETVSSYTGSLTAASAVIPHGTDRRFAREPRSQLPLSSYSLERPFRWLYVSIVDVYKHQWNVVSAVAALRSRGYPVQLDLIGPAYPPALKKLRAAMALHDPAGTFVRYHGPVSHADLHTSYHSADAFVFASTCENMPIILLESMTAGLPIVCSRQRVMQEVLVDGGVYMDPAEPNSLADAMSRLMDDPNERSSRAHRAFSLSKQYSWQRSADATMAFLAASQSVESL